MMEIRELLQQLGVRLGFEVRAGEEIAWEDSPRPGFHFRVQDRASLAVVLGGPLAQPHVVVLPGGRASLIAERARRDPRLRNWLAGGGQIVKFRHIRRLAADASVGPHNFSDRLGIDPPEREDPQLPLL